MATAVSLAMDAFSVSVCAGLCGSGRVLTRSLALGSAFGLFQFAMPLLGALIANRISGFFSGWTPWIAAALICWVAIKMIWEAKNSGSCAVFDLSFKNILILAFATSLDALAVGFSIESAGGSALLLAAAAGIVTFALSFAGSAAGEKLGSKAGERGQYIGGAVLLAIAARIVWSAI